RVAHAASSALPTTRAAAGPERGGDGTERICRLMGLPLRDGAIELTGTRAPRRDRAQPSSGDRPAGVRRNWHLRDACAPLGCPGFKGPVPQPVSMDVRRILLPASHHVNRFM